jgi:hypothetical protein
LERRLTGGSVAADRARAQVLAFRLRTLRRCATWTQRDARCRVPLDGNFGYGHIAARFSGWTGLPRVIFWRQVKHAMHWRNGAPRDLAARGVSRATTDPARFLAPFPLEAASKSALFRQAERIPDRQLLDLLARHLT